MAIQNDNTILRKGDLKAYHDRIVPYLANNLMVRTNVSDYYSTDEKIVGVYMGKPLYQKTILIDTLPNATQENFDTGIANATIDKIVYIFGWTGKKDNLYFRPFPYVYGGSGSDISSLNTIVRLQNAIWVQKNTTSGNWDICIKTGYDRSVETGAVTLKYTKASDTAGSAVATPGAYDINFPNTWPANQEIYFGNGVYGKKVTGTMPALADSGAIIATFATGVSQNARILGYGGLWRAASGFPTRPFGVTVYSTAGERLSTSTFVINASANIILTAYQDAAFPIVGDEPFEAWCTYTK